ncbi:TIR domain-containing protein [Pseudonocardia sp.]|uniref:TIR domain-containing protein n=1 Tax=Pseudonocardia sp. TaxID=60912 RepID=UPI0026369F26|nr:TIR domain-containing protein [Pseudonocardia sp.]
MGGKIAHVSEDLANFYIVETGNPLPIFRDVDDISWGQRWEERVQHGLQNVMFLILAVTPNFLKSAACRSEVTKFQAVCRARGVDNLILPIVFSGKHLIRPDSPDEIAQLIANTQYIPFDEVWFTERTGELWMRTVRRMVMSIIEIESSAEEQLTHALASEATEGVSIDVKLARDSAARRQPIDIDGLDEAYEDDDPQIAEVMESLETELTDLGPLIVRASNTFEEVGAKIGSWSEQRPSTGNAKAINQYFFRVAKELVSR